MPTNFSLHLRKNPETKPRTLQKQSGSHKTTNRRSGCKLTCGKRGSSNSCKSKDRRRATWKRSSSRQATTMNFGEKFEGRTAIFTESGRKIRNAGASTHSGHKHADTWKWLFCNGRQISWCTGKFMKPTVSFLWHWNIRRKNSLRQFSGASVLFSGEFYEVASNPNFFPRVPTTEYVSWKLYDINEPGCFTFEYLPLENSSIAFQTSSTDDLNVDSYLDTTTLTEITADSKLELSFQQSKIMPVVANVSYNNY